MRKRILSLILAGILIDGLTGCGNQKTTDSKTNDKTKNETVQKSKGNCDVFECIKKLSSDTTYEKVNEIIGFEGKLVDQSKEGAVSTYKKYEWELTDDTSITVRLDEFKGKVTAQISSEFPNEMIKNDKVDFSKVDKLKEKINSSDGLTYEEFVEIVGGVEGTLYNVTTFSNKYTWVNSEGKSLNATFNSNGKCTIFNGIV